MDLPEDLRIQYVGSSIAFVEKILFFCFSWVKKNVKETYGGDEEVRDLMLKRSFPRYGHYIRRAKFWKYNHFL